MSCRRMFDLASATHSSSVGFLQQEKESVMVFEVKPTDWYVIKFKF